MSAYYQEECTHLIIPSSNLPYNLSLSLSQQLPSKPAADAHGPTKVDRRGPGCGGSSCAKPSCFNNPACCCAESFGCFDFDGIRQDRSDEVEVKVVVACQALSMVLL